MAIDYPLPNDVTGAIRQNRASNFGLLFHRLQHLPNSLFREDQEKDKDKARVWKKLVEDSTMIFSQMGTVLESLQARQFLMEASLKSSDMVVLDPPLILKVEWRLAIGLGTPSALDTGITLHRLYGFPYIPGSGLKGATRRFRFAMIADALGIPALDPRKIERCRKARRLTPWEKLEKLLALEDGELPRKKLEQLFSSLQQDREVLDQPNGIRDITLPTLRAEYAATFRRAFGNNARQGEVVFMDALPQRLIINGKSILELDIINPHYQAYYTGKKHTPPADYLKPVPVYFLALRAGTPFRFRLVARDQAMLSTVKCWLRDAAQIFGLGAKTMAGYGEMH